MRRELWQRPYLQEGANPREMAAVRNVGASNVVELYAILRWLGFDNRQAFLTDTKGLMGFVFGGISREIHRTGSRDRFGAGGDFFNKVAFPLRSRGTLVDGLAQRPFLQEVDKSVVQNEGDIRILCFHHSTAYSLWERFRERYSKLKIYNWVPNTTAFPGDVYPPVNYFGWHKKTLEEIQKRAGCADDQILLVNPFVPISMAYTFEKNDRTRMDFLKNPEKSGGPLEILVAPSGSGVKLDKLLNMIKGFKQGLNEGWIRLNINLWTNTDQAEELGEKVKKDLGSTEGIDIICHPNEYVAYLSTVKAFRQAHLVLAVAGVWPRWADECGIPSFIFSGFKAGVERPNAEHFEKKGHVIAPMKKIPEELHVSDGLEEVCRVVEAMYARVRGRREIDPLARSLEATGKIMNFCELS